MGKNIDWSAIRADYEAGRMSIRKLAQTYDVSKTTLIERRNKENWNRPPQKGPTTPNSGPRTRDIDAATRAQTAIKIFLEEHPSWDEIAARAGYASRGAAHSAVMRELDRCITHDVKELRTQELYRIEKLQAKCYKNAIDDKNEDYTWVIDRFEKLSKRKSELMGMDRTLEEEMLHQNYEKRIILTHSEDEHASTSQD